jgi:hypothetical protein
MIRRHPEGAQAALVDTRAFDQWVVPQRYTPHRPLHLVALGDAAGSEAYVSSTTGEEVLRTTRAERFWNWLGAVPHWIYFTPLRKDGPLWANTVLWISGACIAVAITGLWIGILRLRLGQTRYGRARRISPYGGWMLWHHVSGVIGGLAVITFIISGWLSLNPATLVSSASFSRAALARYAGDEGRAFPGQPAPQLGAKAPDAVEARFVWIAGTPLVQVSDAHGRHRLLDPGGAPVVLDDARIAGAAARLMPEAPVVRVTRITRDDAYWTAIIMSARCRWFALNSAMPPPPGRMWTRRPAAYSAAAPVTGGCIAGSTTGCTAWISPSCCAIGRCGMSR